MSKSIKIANIECLKNITSDGGAMHEIIRTKKEGHICLAFENKLGRQWGTTTPANLVKQIKKNLGAYEIIMFPLKPYFDIDDLTFSNLKIFTDIINEKIPNGKLSISGSETKEKHSYHITINNYIINNVEERNDFINFIKYLKKECHKSFDAGVYGNNKQMKLVNQTKLNDERKQLIILDDKIENHLITCFFDENPLTIYDFLKPGQYKPLVKTPINENKEVLNIEVQNAEYAETGDFPILNILACKFNEYNDWSKMCWIMKCLNYPFFIFNKYSMAYPEKYDKLACKKKMGYY